MIGREPAFWKVGSKGVVIATSHGIAHEVMNRIVGKSDADGGYSNRICPPKLSKPSFVAILGII